VRIPLIQPVHTGVVEWCRQDAIGVIAEYENALPDFAGSTRNLLELQPGREPGDACGT
jgi:hypothetical protein